MNRAFDVKMSIFSIKSCMSGNVYNDAHDNPDGLYDALLGKWNYNYFKKIAGPGDLGIGTEGSMSQLATDMAGLVEYGKIVSTGNSSASLVPGGKPMGNKFFMETGAKCKNKKGETVPRYVYFDFIPNGYLDLSLTGDGSEEMNLGSSFRGLLPGLLEDIEKLNPLRFFQAFTMGATPPCTEVTLPTGNAGEPGVDPADCSLPGAICETRAMLDSEIDNLPASTFPPQHPKPTIEAFANAGNDDSIKTLFVGGLSLFGIYLVHKLLNKSSE